MGGWPPFASLSYPKGWWWGGGGKVVMLVHPSEVSTAAFTIYPYVYPIRLNFIYHVMKRDF